MWTREVSVIFKIMRELNEIVRNLREVSEIIPKKEKKKDRQFFLTREREN